MNNNNSSIHVDVKPNYVMEQSDPSHSKFVWSYEITITNHSDEPVQLLSRYWHVTDATGKVNEIKGAGVLGRQPLIQPGSEYTYISYCQLPTPQGTMEGYYEMQKVDETKFKVDISKFALSAPESIASMFKSHLH